MDKEDLVRELKTEGRGSKGQAYSDSATHRTTGIITLTVEQETECGTTQTPIEPVLSPTHAREHVSEMTVYLP
jgi:hypothetical protein